MRLRNDYSKAIGKGLRYSERVAASRRLTYVNTGMSATAARQLLDAAGLSYKRVTVTRCDIYIPAEYLRIYT